MRINTQIATTSSVWNASGIGVTRTSAIRTWVCQTSRDAQVRRCPLCRATSFYVIPSNVPIFDQDVKDQIIEMYKKNMSSGSLSVP